MIQPISILSIYTNSVGVMSPHYICKLLKELSYSFVSISDINNFSSYVSLINEASKFSLVPILSIIISTQYKNIRGSIQVIFKNETQFKSFCIFYNEVVKRFKSRFIYETKLIFFDFDELKDYLSGCFIIVGSKGSLLEEAVKNNILYYLIADFYNEFHSNFFLSYSRLDNSIEKELAEVVLSQNYNHTIISHPIVHFTKEDFYTHAYLISLQEKITVVELLKTNSADNYYGEEYRFYTAHELSLMYTNSEDKQAIYNLKIFLKSLEKFKNFLTNNSVSFLSKLSTLENEVITIVENKLDNFAKNILCPNLDEYIISDAYVLYKERFDLEINEYKNSNLLTSIHLVYDLILFANKMNLIISPSRGCFTGSLVLFLLEISKLDPIENNLLFEKSIYKEDILNGLKIITSKEDKLILYNYLIEKYKNSDHLFLINTIYFDKYFIDSNPINILKDFNSFNIDSSFINLSYKPVKDFFNEGSALMCKTMEKFELIIEEFLTFNITDLSDQKIIIQSVQKLLEDVQYIFNIPDCIQSIISSLLEFNSDFRLKLFEVFNYLKEFSNKLNSLNIILENIRNCIKTSTINNDEILIIDKKKLSYFPISFDKSAVESSLLQFDTSCLFNLDIFKLKLSSSKTINVLKILSVYNNISLDYKSFINDRNVHALIKKIYLEGVNKFQFLIKNKDLIQNKISNIDPDFILSLVALNDISSVEILMNYFNNKFVRKIKSKSIFKDEESNKDEEVTMDDEIYDFLSSTRGVLLFKEQSFTILDVLDINNKILINELKKTIAVAKNSDFNCIKNRIFTEINGQNINIRDRSTKIFWIDKICTSANYLLDKSYLLSDLYSSSALLFFKNVHTCYFLKTYIETYSKNHNEISSLIAESILINQDIFIISPSLTSSLDIQIEKKNNLIFLFASLLFFADISNDIWHSYLINDEKDTIKRLYDSGFPIKLLKSVYKSGFFRYLDISLEELEKKFIHLKRYSKEFEGCRTLFSSYNDSESYSLNYTLSHSKIPSDLTLFLKSEEKNYKLSFLKINLATLILRLIEDKKVIFLTTNVSDNYFVATNITSGYSYKVSVANSMKQHLKSVSLFNVLFGFGSWINISSFIITHNKFPHEHFFEKIEVTFIKTVDFSLDNFYIADTILKKKDLNREGLKEIAKCVIFTKNILVLEFLFAIESNLIIGFNPYINNILEDN